MPSEITMPQLSDTMTEGTLVKWTKNEGDAVKAGEEIAEVETDKATMPMEAFEAGVLAVRVAKEGDKIAVGGTVGVVALKGEDVAQIKAKYGGGGAAKAEAPKPAAQPAKPAEAKPQASGGAQSNATPPKAAAVPGPAKINLSENKEATSNANDHKETAHGQAGEATKVAAEHVHESHSSGRVVASPLAKRVAEEKGVELQGMTGTGPGGRIVRDDVLAAVANGKHGPDVRASGDQGAANQPTGTHAAGPEIYGQSSATIAMPDRLASGQSQTIELSKMRQTIANRLQLSKQQIPHFYVTIDIDMTAANELRKQLLAAYEKSEGIRISIGDIIAKAVATTLKRTPVVNATFGGTSVTRHADVHLGMAVALPDGLIVPVLRHIDQMGVKEIRQRSNELVDRARKQRLKREEMSGATFTVSNLGVMGVREFSAIVNPPEVGILAIGAVEDRAVIRNGQVVSRSMMTVTLSADHRAVDGADGAKFVATLKQLLETPAMMIA